MTALAQALTPLIARADLERALEQFTPRLQSQYSTHMRAKFGLVEKYPEDSAFFNDSFELMESEGVDYTRFFRALSCLDSHDNASLIDLFVDRTKAEKWLSEYLLRCEKEALKTPERCEQMRKVNPKYILRNYLAQQAIDKAEQGDFSLVHTLAEVLKTPYDEQSECNYLAKLPPEWGKRMAISCSS
ncbi:selenoprotein O and cysteine-containing homologs [Vibrio maritimus]|uniref:Selenoprotein O and cysteine-containing homologs n=1 Tax=Vibrio maritimus TaxID=990268 RepID=A0A090T6Z5_9VIBR|nr:selenoprotein O and cysteine-containing homologs [Vibrio maritimus]